MKNFLIPTIIGPYGQNSIVNLDYVTNIVPIKKIIRFEINVDSGRGAIDWFYESEDDLEREWNHIIAHLCE